MQAILKGRKYDGSELCEILVQNGGDVNHTNNDDETLLILAAKKGTDDICSLLLQNGARVNSTDKSGKTALDIAKELGFSRTVRVITEFRADSAESYKHG